MSRRRMVPYDTELSPDVEVSLRGATLLILTRYPQGPHGYGVIEERDISALTATRNPVSVEAVEDMLTDAWDRDAGEPHVPCLLAVELASGLIIHQHST